MAENKGIRSFGTLAYKMFRLQVDSPTLKVIAY